MSDTPRQPEPIPESETPPDVPPGEGGPAPAETPPEHKDGEEEKEKSALPLFPEL